MFNATKMILIQKAIEDGLLTFREIAVKYNVSLREVDMIAMDLMDQYEAEEQSFEPEDLY